MTVLTHVVNCNVGKQTVQDLQQYGTRMNKLNTGSKRNFKIYVHHQEEADQLPQSDIVHSTEKANPCPSWKGKPPWQK